MPRYDFKCQKCEKVIEFIKSYTDKEIPNCPDCNLPMKKMIGNVTIAFKGPGFHCTDYGTTSNIEDNNG